MLWFRLRHVPGWSLSCRYIGMYNLVISALCEKCLEKLNNFFKVTTVRRKLGKGYLESDMSASACLPACLPVCLRLCLVLK